MSPDELQRFGSGNSRKTPPCSARSRSTQGCAATHNPLEFGRLSREFKRINRLCHRNKRFVRQRMEMSTKRLFHYKQEMRAFDW